MEISTNKVVALSYTLVVDGDVIETVTAENPMQFIFGTGYLLPKFEENVSGKVVGDSFDFKLSAKEGYGEENPDAIVELPVDIFKIDGQTFSLTASEIDSYLKVSNRNATAQRREQDDKVID